MGIAAGVVMLTAIAALNASSGLETAVADYDRAQIDGNGDALNRLLADDYRLVNSAGEVETKPQFIAESTAPGFKVDPFHVVKAIERRWTDGAVMGGVALLTVHDQGRTSSACLRFADIWSFRDGRWQVAYTQVAKAKPEDCA